MPGRRDPNFYTGHLCRFCGELVAWGTILRLIRVDPDTPGYMLNESACHSECLRKVIRPEVPLTFHRHWDGRAPMLDDDADIFLPLDGRSGPQGSAEPHGSGECPRRGGQVGVTPETPSTSEVTPPQPSPSRGGSKPIRPCAMCARPIAPAALVRLRVQRPTGPVKRPEFDEQTLPLHFDCLAAVSTSRLF